MTEFESYVDITIAAPFLDSCESSVYHWQRPISKGGKGLPSHKIAGRLKFKISELENWVQDQNKNTADSGASAKTGVRYGDNKVPNSS